MPALVLKNVSLELHERLKEQSKAHHRSMMQEAVTILETGLGLSPKAVKPHVPRKGKFPLTPEFLDEAINEGRP